MTGYCLDCESTACTCDDLPSPPPLDRWHYLMIRADQVETCPECGRGIVLCEHATATLTSPTLAFQAKVIAELQEEIRLLKQREWEPADGIWRVERTEYGRSSTLVAPLDAPEDEAIVRAALQRHGDAACRAITGVYRLETFCPTMLEHREHGGHCGVWPSAYTIWSAIREAIAKESTRG